jgi:hypothetical protein
VYLCNYEGIQCMYILHTLNGIHEYSTTRTTCMYMSCICTLDSSNLHLQHATQMHQVVRLTSRHLVFCFSVEHATQMMVESTLENRR